MAYERSRNNLMRKVGTGVMSACTVLCIARYFEIIFFFLVFLFECCSYKSWTLLFVWLSLDLHLQNWAENLRRILSHANFSNTLCFLTEAEVRYQVRLPPGIGAFNPSENRKLIGQCENERITEIKILFKPWRACLGLNKSLDQEFW